MQNWLVLWLDGSLSWTTAYDVSGNGNNWTLSSSSNITKQRVLQNAWFVKASTDDRITVTRNSWLEPINWTVACWFKMSRTWAAQVLVGINNVINADTYWYLLYIDSSNRIAWEVDSSSAFNQAIWTLALNDSKYHLWVLTWDWTNVKTFLDWVQHTSISQTLTIAYNNQDIKIGWDSTANTRYFWGDIINPMIWNRALSATEIMLLRNSTFIK